MGDEIPTNSRNIDESCLCLLKSLQEIYQKYYEECFLFVAWKSLPELTRAYASEWS